MGGFSINETPFTFTEDAAPWGNEPLEYGTSVSISVESFITGSPGEVPYINPGGDGFNYDVNFKYVGGTDTLYVPNLAVTTAMVVDDITEYTADAGVTIENVALEDGGITLGTGETVNTIEDAVTDDDTHIPTSGAIVDYLAGSFTPERVARVAKSGGDFTTIQAAIDSITDAAIDKRYAVIVYPGDYAEAVTMEDYVDIIGTGRTNSRITGTTGTVLTFPATKATIQDMGIYVDYGTLGANSTAITSAGGDSAMIRCDIGVTKSGGHFTMNALAITAGAFRMSDCYFTYSITGATGAPQLTQSAIVQSGVLTTFLMNNNEVTVTSNDVDDDLVGFETTANVTGTYLIANNVIDIDAGAAGTSATGLWLYGTSTGGTIAQNRITVNCDATAYGLWVDSTAGGAIVDSRHNEIIITAVGTAQSAIVETGDIWNSVFDKITAKSGYTGAGTVTFASSDIDGGLGLTGDIVFTERADHASTPAAGYGYLWVKNNTPSSLIFTNDAGTDYTFLSSTNGSDNRVAVYNAEYSIEGTVNLIVDDAIPSTTIQGDLDFAERADHASTPGGGHGYLWVRSDTPSSLIFTDDAGADFEISHGIVGTNGVPADNQIAVFTDADTIEGDTGLLYDSGTGYLDVEYIIRAVGSLQHLTIEAGNASGGAGTDAGDLCLTAGDAILADAASACGNVYISPGCPYATNDSGYVYLGNSDYDANYIYLAAAGNQANVVLAIEPKGTAPLYLGDSGGNNTTICRGDLQLMVDLEFISSHDGIILGAGGIPAHHDGYDITMVGGTAYTTSGDNGGNILIYGGAPDGAGNRGNVYIGDGAANAYLPAKTTETDVVHYNTTTGLLSYAKVAPLDAEINSQAMAYTVVAGDAGKIIECTGTGNLTLPDSLDTGFQCTIVNTGVGTITLVAATTLHTKGGNVDLATQYGAASAYHQGSDVWIAFGDLT